MENTTTIATLGDITRIEYNGQFVLTTAQLAAYYDTETDYKESSEI